LICRRDILAAGLMLTPLASLLAACGKASGWPEGMVEIKWDRDTCARCNMVISDRRFAAQIRGGEEDRAFKFDDIGCLVFWIRDKAAAHPWMATPAIRMWVADATGRPDQPARWLDPRSAQFLPGRISPMGYNFAAVAGAEAGSIDFAALREQLLARGK
jgi:copper chaperone NosL